MFQGISRNTYMVIRNTCIANEDMQMKTHDELNLQRISRNTMTMLPDFTTRGKYTS